jgi:hypothetical protein
MKNGYLFLLEDFTMSVFLKEISTMFKMILLTILPLLEIIFLNSWVKVKCRQLYKLILENILHQVEMVVNLKQKDVI